MKKTILAATLLLGLSSPMLSKAESVNVIELRNENNRSFIAPSSKALFAAEQFSFFGWFKPSDAPRSTEGSRPNWTENIVGRWGNKFCIFALKHGPLGLTATFAKDGFEVPSESNSKISYKERLVNFSTSTPMEPEQWNFVGLVFDGKRATLYMRDTQETIHFDSPMASAGLSPQNPAADPMRIGGGVAMSPSGFRGVVTEISYWKKALSEEEVAAVRNGKLTGSEEGLYLYFSSASASTTEPSKVIDLGPEQLDGTLRNAQWIKADFP